MSLESSANNPVMSEQTRLETEIRVKLINDSRYTVQPGQTSYNDIARTIAPNDPREAQKLIELNGHERLQPGMSISTMDPYQVEAQTTRQVSYQLAAEQQAAAAQESARAAAQQAAVAAHAQDHQFQGIHFPLRLGVQDGSLKIGTPDPFDIPHAGVSIGQQTGVEVGGTIGPVSGTARGGLEFGHNSVGLADEEHVQAFGQPILDHRHYLGVSASRNGIALDNDSHTRVLGYNLADSHTRIAASVSRQGLRLDESSSGQVLNGLAGYDQGAGAVVGPQSGYYLRGQAHVGAAVTSFDHSADLGVQGFHVNAAGETRVGNLVGAKVNARLALDNNSQFVVGGGAFAGPYGAAGEAGLVTNGNRELRLTAYPTGDAPPVVEAAPPVGAPVELMPPGAQPPVVQEPLSQLTPGQSTLLDQSLVTQAAEQNGSAVIQEDPETVRRALRQQISQDSLYTVKAGEHSYADVMRDIDPSRESESPFLAQINRHKRLREGAQVQTLSAQEIDWKTKVAFAQHFNLPMPQA